MSCLTVHISRPVVGVVKTDCVSAPMEVSARARVGGFEAAEATDRARVTAHANRTGDITLGLVCGNDLGAMILCGSDGVLLTVDGNYLIVRRR